jgi:hypothetical protein
MTDQSAGLAPSVTTGPMGSSTKIDVDGVVTVMSETSGRAGEMSGGIRHRELLSRAL